MAKSKVSFSIELLESNLKYHKKDIKYLNKVYKIRKMALVDKNALKEIDKRLSKSIQFFDDITLAIKTLKKIK